jgi:hypothetical protein
MIYTPLLMIYKLSIMIYKGHNITYGLHKSSQKAVLHLLSQKLTEQPSLNKKGERTWQKESPGCRQRGI